MKTVRASGSEPEKNPNKTTDDKFLAGIGMRRGKQKGGVVAIEETLAGLLHQPLQIKISAAPLKVCAAQGSSICSF